MKFFDVGDEAHGVIAIGQYATGVFALGQAATGVIAIGQIARGAVAIGQGAIGLVALGQGAVGLFWSCGMLSIGGNSIGMLALGARARGLLPISVWPRAVASTNGQPPPLPVSLEQLTHHRVERGWVRARLAAGGINGVRLTVNGTPLPVQITRPEWASRIGRDVLALLAWEQRVVASDDVASDYRRAPAFETGLTCLDVVDLPAPAANAWLRRVATVVMMAVVAASIWFITGVPLVDELTSDTPPPHFIEIHNGSSDGSE